MNLKLKPFLSVLGYVGTAIKEKTTLPVLSYVHLHAEHGKLNMRGSSLELFILQDVECEGDLDRICVKHSALLSILQGSDAETVELTLTGDKLVVAMGKAIFRLHTIAAEEFPPDPTIGMWVSVPATTLSAGLWATSWSIISPKGGRPAFEQVIVDLGQTRMRCYASNGYTLASYREDCICETKTLTVPGVHAITLAKALLSKSAFFWQSDRHVGVNSQHGFVAALRSDHPMPAFETIIKEIEKPAVNAMLPLESLKKVCSMGRSLSDNVAEISKVLISITNGLVELSGNGNLGDFHDSFEWEGQHDATIYLNAAYLATALSHFKADKISVHSSPSASVWSDGALTIAISQLNLK